MEKAYIYADYALLLAMFKLLYSSTNQKLFEKHQNGAYGKHGQLKGNPSHATTRSTPYFVSKNEWNTKEGTGKSMKKALYVLWFAKRHLL